MAAHSMAAAQAMPAFQRLTGRIVITPDTHEERQILIAKLMKLRDKAAKEARLQFGAAEAILCAHLPGPACTRDGLLITAHAQESIAAALQAEIIRLKSVHNTQAAE